jgi:hypothetical protein
MNKKITEAQYLKDLKCLHPNMSKEDIDWHVNLFRKTKQLQNTHDRTKESK